MIELMVTVSVLAVMAALAAPSFKQLLAAQRMRSLAYSMVADLVLARSEAIKRGEKITMTPLSTSWDKGWLITAAPTDEVLGRQNDVGSGVQFTAAPTSLTFDRNGRAVSAAVIRFGISDGGTRYRCISLDPSGRPKNTASGCPV